MLIFTEYNTYLLMIDRNKVTQGEVKAMNWPTNAQSLSELTFRVMTSSVFSGISGGIREVVESNSTW